MEKIKLDCTVDNLKTEGFAERRTLENSERVARAGKMFGILFVVALFTVFIPLLHFILPPLILIVACVFATTTYMETGEVLGGAFTCPNCQRAMELRHEAEDWPKTQRCEGCSYTLTLSPKAP